MNAPTSSPPSAASTRLMSVNALRGFDVLWIVGAGAIVMVLEQMSGLV